MSELFVRCRICNTAYKVAEDDIEPATVVLASEHQDVPLARTYVVIYTLREAAMAAIRNSGFADDDMVIPIFTRPQGWGAQFN